MHNRIRKKHKAPSPCGFPQGAGPVFDVILDLFLLGLEDAGSGRIVLIHAADLAR